MDNYPCWFSFYSTGAPVVSRALKGIIPLFFIAHWEPSDEEALEDTFTFLTFYAVVKKVQKIPLQFLKETRVGVAMWNQDKLIITKNMIVIPFPPMKGFDSLVVWLEEPPEGP